MPVQRPEIKEPKKRKTKYLEKSKVLFIADSVGRNVDFRKLEKASNVRIRTRRAYSSVFNTTARWPEMNVTDVIKHEVNKVSNEDKYDVLVMSAPTVDITNLDTAQVKATDNVEFFKQEVLISSKNMISAAENTLKSELNIKKAIILCHPPRFDRPEVDPLMLKQKLAKFANDQLHQLWLDSPLKDKIFIAEHKLNCNMNVRMDRYTDEHTKKYDGIHMYGESGRSAYTESVVSALKEALCNTGNPPNPHTLHLLLPRVSLQTRITTSIVLKHSMPRVIWLVMQATLVITTQLKIVTGLVFSTRETCKGGPFPPSPEEIIRIQNIEDSPENTKSAPIYPTV